MIRAGVLAALGFAAGLSSLSATQRQPPALARWESSASAAAADSSAGPKRDYRLEGVVVGGLFFGALGAYVGSQIRAGCPLSPGGCDDGSDRVLSGIATGLAGAAVGSGLGYLIGRFSPRKPRPDTLLSNRPTLTTLPDSVRVITGYPIWRGATLGLVIGAAAGTVLGAVAPLDCADCNPPSRGHVVWRAGLLGAGAGGLVGFLAGLTSPRYAWVPRDNSPETTR
jgi:hypothetical protein